MKKWISLALALVLIFSIPMTTQAARAVIGDFDGDGSVNNADVAYLLWHTLFPEDYPIAGQSDFDGDGSVNNEDVAYLLWHTLFPEDYPLDNEPTDDPTDDPTEDPSHVMTHAEYMAAEDGTQVVIEAYVQGNQSWWENKICVYAQDRDGGYFIYNMTCSEQDSKKLVPGTKIRVTGYKTVWCGLHEIAEGATFEILNAKPYIAEPMDVTGMMQNNDALIRYQGAKVGFQNATIVPIVDVDGIQHAFLYRWDGLGGPGSDNDLYFDAEINGEIYHFVIEYYLCDEDTDVYKAVQSLKIGDKVNMEGFMYWYDDPLAHITSLSVIS